LEQRGTGRSQPKPYDNSTINIATARQDVIRLMNHFKMKQTHILGHSWGGMLAMSFAALFPDRVKSLILVDSGPFRLDAQLAEIYSVNMEVRLSEEEKTVPVLYDRTKVYSLMHIINKGGLNPSTGSLLMQSMIKANDNIAGKLGQLKASIYIIAGAQDPGGFVSYEIKLFAPKSQLFWIKRAGYFSMYEQPAEFTKY
jgi:pimeloyl-ACP methyl ester carboxylesterase